MPQKLKTTLLSTHEDMARELKVYTRKHFKVMLRLYSISVNDSISTIYFESEPRGLTDEELIILKLKFDAQQHA